MLRLAAGRVASSGAINKFALPSALAALAPPAGAAQSALQRGFSSTPLQFDTHKVVTSLREKGQWSLLFAISCWGFLLTLETCAGFSTEQSEAILEVMKASMAESLDAQARIVRNAFMDWESAHRVTHAVNCVARDQSRARGAQGRALRARFQLDAQIRCVAMCLCLLTWRLTH